MRHALSFLALILMLSGFSGCASVDGKNMRASSDIPESAKVDELNIPYDESLPRYVLIVEPVRFEGQTTVTSSRDTTSVKGGHTLTMQQPSRPCPSANCFHRDEEQLIDKLPSSKPQTIPIGLSKSAAAAQKSSVSITSSTTTTSSYEQATTSYYTDRETQRIASQLTSSLSGVKNFRLIDARYAAAKGVKIEDAKGPYLIRATVTEFSGESEGTNEKLNLFTIYSSNAKLSRGVVALDVSILDARTGEVISSFPARGSFGEEEQRRGVGLIAKVVETEALARSMMSQATRVAANEAAKRALEILAGYSVK